MSFFVEKPHENWQALNVTPKATGEVCPNAITPPNAITLPSRDRKGAVSDWVTANLQFTPDNLQAEVLDATEDSVLLLCTRQWGKSTIAAAKALHHALTTPKAFIIVASASKRQSAELVRKFKEFAETIGLKVKRDAEGFTLPNRARIIPVPQNPEKVRGYSAPTLIIIDEAAYVKDDMYEAVTPMLATSNGALWLMSTAGAQRGFFFKTWQTRPDGWKLVQATADDCPRISVHFLARERAAKGEAFYRREYLCEFVAGHQQMVSQEDADAIFDTDF
jgi:hypothetical protein